jgi:Mycoplasma protein of unknown function, DUF285
LFRTFNHPLTGSWDVSTVTDMSSMFGEAAHYHQAIVSSVTNMNSMFYFADSFDQDIGPWNVSGVTDMTDISAWAIAFDQNLSAWSVTVDLSQVNVTGMFDGSGCGDTTSAHVHTNYTIWIQHQHKHH